MRSVEHNIDVDSDRLKTLTEKAEKYSHKVARIVTKCDYSKSEVSLAISSDEEYQQNVAAIAEELKGNLKHVVVIGIGGSSLGIEALYHALAFSTQTKLHVLDSIGDESIHHLEIIIERIDDPKELAVCIISKSGNTTETVTNATLFIEAGEKKYGKEIRKRIVFIGTEGSAFIENGKKEKVLTASIPEAIGGRYSVFTAVGMIPLTLAGIDVTSIRKGAKSVIEKKNRNGVIEHAAKLVALAESGVHTVNFFVFNDRLKLLGLWYRQLLAESIGKQMKTDGVTFSHQLLPTVSTSIDLHSMAQLYLGGYKGMYTHFIYGDVESDHHKFSDHWMMRHLDLIKDHTPREIKNAIKEGVLQAYDDQKLPYRITTFSKITAEELGFLMASLMFEVMLLGELFDVDPFNQPNVESYKLHTRDILSST